MGRLKGKALGGVIGAVALIAILAASMGGGGAGIEVIHPWRGPVRESFREPGRTRLEHTWTLAAPVSGTVSRIELEPGDRVKTGDEPARYDMVPFDTAVADAEATLAQLEAQLAVLDDDSLEETSRAEAEANVKSAEESVRAARSRAESARVQAEHHRKELERIAALANSGSISDTELDNQKFLTDTAVQEFTTAQSVLAAEEARVTANRLASRRVEESLKREKIERNILIARIDQARAAVAGARHNRGLARLIVPVDGVVLDRASRGERPVTAGEPLLEIGRPEEIEMVVDVLTQDAMKLRPGGEVMLESTIAGVEIPARVKRIEPQGFTKLSSLGVEQQRVNVIVSLAEAEKSGGILGVGYRLYARFFTGEKEDALLVPRFSVLQAPDQSYYVYVIEDGMLRRRAVEIGLRSDLEFEITSGLTEQNAVVTSPDSKMEEGAAAEAKFVTTGNRNRVRRDLK